ncbi:MAG TPA: ABC transporter ATP-binding protein [Myxococcaceae bacterium]|nr:ABC transporter ATP-binding protein [Myxococcaceae bacterium]
MRFEGREILGASPAELNRVRGSKLTMIFQDPMTSLTPHLKVGIQLAEVLVNHSHISWREAEKAALRVLERVRVPEAQRRLRQYPHELSGGMRQRVMIAMALACNPDLLIADEPITALDVTIQAQILDLIQKLQSETRMAVMLITHDLGIVAETCGEVAVMYAGRIVERAPVKALFATPAHPYTAGLLRSIPSLEKMGGVNRRLAAIPGTVPDPRHLPGGCRFRDRCDRAIEICSRIDPPLELKREGQLAACHNPMP